MHSRKRHRYRSKRLTAGMLFLAVTLVCLLPGAAPALKQEKTVRVGWYESSFNQTDQFGRRSGYGYEYQQRVSIYTGWKYEYVDGSWPELLEKLIAGEIDLLTDVSHTEERAEKILYSSEAMGSEVYHIYISSGNTAIRPDDYSTLNGKRVGVNKNSIQEKMFAEWAESYGITPKIIELTEKAPVLMKMLADGEIDALVSIGTFGDPSDLIPVCKIGFSEIYFGINKNRPDLKQDLDMAMNRLLEDNRDYNQQMTERFNPAGTVNSFLSPEEKEWLAAHGPVRVGYRDDFLPFCDQDDRTGGLTGALSDYLAAAGKGLQNAQISFEAVPYPTTEAALQAVKDREVDCAFPLSISSYDGEQRGTVCTDPLITSEMYAAVRTADHQGLEPDRKMTVAMVRGNPSYVTFIRDHFPNWEISYYESTEAAFQAVSAGKADYSLVNNFLFSRLGSLLEKYALSVLTTNEAVYVSFALNREDDCLYSILNKAVRQMSPAFANTSLTRYSFQDEEITLEEFLRRNWMYMIAAAAIVTVAILSLVIWNLRTKQKAAERQQIISQTERDPLTGVYNRDFFFAYANQIHRTNPGKHMNAIVLNIERFHSVNALIGREYGDQVLRKLGKEILDFCAESGSIAGRNHADRFNLYCQEGLSWDALYERLQRCMDRQSDKVSIRLRMGVKPWQEGMDPELQFDKARIACKWTRGTYKSQVLVFDADMERREERDQRLMNDLETALEKHELMVYYQPKYLVSSETPQLSSAEALVRWNHPELGIISPDEFIQLFEQSGQISVLDRYVWRETARQIAQWRDRYGYTLPVSVNLSRVDVFDPELAATLDGLIEQYGLKSSDLKLEVTESAYTENADQLIRVINGLREKGYQIEMDDFGSGYSSLNMLSSLPIDVLKMDIAFIQNIERDEKNLRLVKLIIDIARYLQVPVVAEGVETENQLKLLRNAGCDILQGYYFSRPLPPEEFERKILPGAQQESRRQPDGCP